MPKAAKVQRREWLMPPTLSVHLHRPGLGREQYSQERSGRSEGARATAGPGQSPPHGWGSSSHLEGQMSNLGVSKSALVDP